MGHSSNRVEPLLAELHYAPLWLAYDFIDEQSLRRQVEQYRTSDDNSSEHYRYRAFCAFLAARADLDDISIDRYVELALLDEDRQMAQGALTQLVDWAGLTDAQLQRLRQHPAFTSPILRKRVERQWLQRELRRAPLDDELFAQCLASGDATVQWLLLANAGISRGQLEALKVQGANRRVRNTARAKLGRR